MFSFRLVSGAEVFSALARNVWGAVLFAVLLYVGLKSGLLNARISDPIVALPLMLTGFWLILKVGRVFIFRRETMAWVRLSLQFGAELRWTRESERQVVEKGLAKLGKEVVALQGIGSGLAQNRKDFMIRIWDDARTLGIVPDHETWDKYFEPQEHKSAFALNVR